MRDVRLDTGKYATCFHVGRIAAQNFREFGLGLTVEPGSSERKTQVEPVAGRFGVQFYSLAVRGHSTAPILDCDALSSSRGSLFRSIREIRAEASEIDHPDNEHQNQARSYRHSFQHAASVLKAISLSYATLGTSASEWTANA